MAQAQRACSCSDSPEQLRCYWGNRMPGLATPRLAPLSGRAAALLGCAKNAIYMQLWPLGTIKVEKYVKGAVKKLRPSNTTGNTNEAYFRALIS